MYCGSGFGGESVMVMVAVACLSGCYKGGGSDSVAVVIVVAVCDLVWR